MKRIFYIGALSALLLTACGEEDTAPKEKTTNTNTEEVKEEAPISKEQAKEKQEATTLTIDKFEATFRKIIDETKQDSSIEMKDMELLEEGMYSSVLTSNMVVFAGVNKKKEVEKIYIATTSDAIHNKELEIAYHALLKSVDNNLSTTQQSVIFDKLGISWDRKMLDRTESYSLNEVSYTYQSNIEKDSIILKAELD